MPKQLGESQVYARQAEYAMRQAFVATGSNGAGQVEYLAWADPGTAEATALWQIRKFSYNSTGQWTKTEFADGDGEFDNSWTGYADLTYS